MDKSTQVVSVRLPIALYQRLTGAAQKENRSLNRQIVHLLLQVSPDEPEAKSKKTT